jgi:hypothetical protein
MQSTQAKQRKRERKRLKREEKRRGLQASLPDWSPLSPWPDISDTFVDYAQPLLERVPPGCTPGQLRRALLIASGVWNAVVAKRGDIDGAVELVTRTLAEEVRQPVPRGWLATIERLAVRKLARFDDDDRIVTDVDVHLVGDRFRVLASSESPPPEVRLALRLGRLNQLVDKAADGDSPCPPSV